MVLFFFFNLGVVTHAPLIPTEGSGSLWFQGQSGQNKEFQNSRDLFACLYLLNAGMKGTRYSNGKHYLT